MKRSTSITVAGALLLAGGIFVGFGAIMSILGQWMLRSMPPLPNMPKTEIPLAAMVIGLAWEALAAAWAIVTAVGIFRLRRWAWISILVLSGVVALSAGFAVAGMVATLLLVKTMPPEPGVPESFMTMTMVVAIFIFLIPLACGIWWLVLFTRKSVRMQFASSRELEMPQARLTAHTPVAVGFAPPESASPKIPVSILVIAIYLAAFILFFPITVAMPFMRRMPVMLFGRVIWQGHAWIYMLAVGLAHLVIGIGLLTRKNWAWTWACLYALFMVANSLGTVATPHSFDRMIELLGQAIPELAQFSTVMPSGLRTMYYVGMIPGLGLPVVALYFLWTRRAAYRAACVASKPNAAAAR